MGKGNDSRHGRRKPAPITAHPAFAALVALWFAALLGLGSLIPSIDPLVRMLGLQAASPLMHLLLKIALAAFMGLIGFLLGSAIAGLFARGRTRSPAEEPAATRAPTLRDIEADAARRPIIAHEELGTEGLGPVQQEAWAEEQDQAEIPPAEEEIVRERFDSPWLADEDGHIWSEELADAPLVLSTHDILPDGTTPVAPERPLAELGMAELIERLAHAIQNRHGVAPTLPDNAAEMVRRLDAEVQGNNTAYASFREIEALSAANPAQDPAPADRAATGPVDKAVIFPDASARRAQGIERGEIAIPEGDKEADALRSALETLRRMSGTA